MRILYVSDRQDGGILQHVRCLRECLPPEVETYEIGRGGDEEFAGRNGHDFREWIQIRRVIRTFKPDIVHFHIPALMMILYARFFSRVRLVRSWHISPLGTEGLKDRIIRWLLGSRCYYLPVSVSVWEGLRRWAPHIQGEVFLNPLRLGERSMPVFRASWKGQRPTVGMVGRDAEVKDWPSFHVVERLVKEHLPGAEFVNGGEKMMCNGREVIAALDLFIMTSKNEALPTTMLECFLLGTPICGFLPKGGARDVLAFSTGPVRDAFMEERDCAKLAELVECLLKDADRRMRMVEDGWRILTQHFAAENLVKGQLMDVYGRVVQRGR